jgi:hypothetical protein
MRDKHGPVVFSCRADAQAVADAINAAAPEPPAPGVELCEDEGCPHHGMKHVCTTPAEVWQYYTQSAINGRRVWLDCDSKEAAEAMVEQGFDVRQIWLAPLAAPNPPAPVQGVSEGVLAAFGAAFRSVEAVTEMELHQLATGETLPSYRIARRAAETELWLLMRSHGDALTAALHARPPAADDRMADERERAIVREAEVCATIRKAAHSTPPAPSAGVSVSEVTPAEIMAACNTIYPQFDHYSGDTRADIRRDVENALTAFLDGRAAAQVHANDSGVG